MDTPTLIEGLTQLLDEIPKLIKFKQGIHHPRVKAWRTRLIEVLSRGGKACQSALESIKRLGLETLNMEDTFINQQSYISQLQAADRVLRQTVQTLEVFGRPEDRDILERWPEPKSERRADGHLMIGDLKVDPKTITLREVFECIVGFTKASNDLTQEMRKHVLASLQEITGNPLYQPFLIQRLDKVLEHWPENVPRLRR